MIPDRIKRAWRLGYRAGRSMRRRGYVLFAEYMQTCPYSTYMPGVQCRVAWRLGYRMAYGLAPDGQGSRQLYAL